MNELEKERKKQLEEQHKIAFYHGIAERKKIQGLNNRINNLQSKIDKVKRILNANTHVENIYHALCNLLLDEEYKYEIDNEELLDILKEVN